MDNVVELHIENEVGTIEFSSRKSNALNTNMLKALKNKIIESGNNPNVKVILLKSGGAGTFCAGADFDELQTLEKLAGSKAFFMGFALVINAIRKVPKFVISRVQGKTVGGGMGLIAATDYCLASQQASVKLSELAMGIGPFVVGPAIKRKIGIAAFSQLAINYYTFHNASWANQHGLFTDIFEDITQMDNAVSVLTEKLTKLNPESMAKMKKILWENTDHWDDLLEERAATSGKLALSPFTKQFIHSFKKK